MSSAMDSPTRLVAAVDEDGPDGTDAADADQAPPTDAPPDPDLAAARRGDPAAMNRLYDRHAVVVLSICRILLPEQTIHDADDASQETFLRCFRMLDRLADGDAFRPWLYAIARNVCAERRRAGARRTRHEGLAQHNGWAGAHRNGLPASAPSEAAEQRDRLTHALAALPERERLAMHLHMLDADPVEAAREALGLSRSGFYKLLARAKRRLGRAMRGEEEC